MNKFIVNLMIVFATAFLFVSVAEAKKGGFSFSKVSGVKVPATPKIPTIKTTPKTTSPKKDTPKTTQNVKKKQEEVTKSNAEKSTGRTVPKNLKEQLAMEQVKANPQGKTYKGMPSMSDTKNGWLAKDGWVKRAQNVNGVEIHYIENTKTGETTDFKFIDKK